MAIAAENPSWKGGIDYEVSFWDRYFRTRGGQWAQEFINRMNPVLPLQPHFAMFLEHLPQPTVSLLDVGAGPLTLLGKVHPTKKLQIVATDALAAQYDMLLERYGLEPPVRTILVEAERLVDAFQPNSFDFVNAINCIDHTRDPVAAISAMVEVCKPGCFVHLGHYENEGANENFEGFHFWNFTVEQGNFMVRGHDGSCFNVTEILGGQAQIQSKCEDKYVVVDMKKNT